MIIPIDDDQPKTSISPVTHGLIAVNVLISALVFTRQDPASVLMAWSFHPHHPTPLTWLSSIFLHAGLGHLLGNMLFLHIAGRSLEYKLGPWKFLALYFGSAVLADIVQSIASPLPSLGASGAISGLFSAYVILLPWGEVKLFYWFSLWWIGTWSVSAIWLLLYFVGEQIVFLGIYGSSAGVGFAAHLGGVAGGAIAALILRRTLPPEETLRAARLETQGTLAGARRGPVAIPRTRQPSLRSVRASERDEASVPLERAVIAGESARAVRLYEQTALLSGAPVLTPSSQEALAAFLLEANERDLAKQALRDLVRVHPATSAAHRAQRLLARLEATRATAAV